VQWVCVEAGLLQGLIIKLSLGGMEEMENDVVVACFKIR
jgi:hypothetical protein